MIEKYEFWRDYEQNVDNRYVEQDLVECDNLIVRKVSPMLSQPALRNLCELLVTASTTKKRVHPPRAMNIQHNSDDT
jgi:hypothetical protein